MPTAGFAGRGAAGRRGVRRKRWLWSRVGSVHLAGASAGFLAVRGFWRPRLINLGIYTEHGPIVQRFPRAVTSQFENGAARLPVFDRKPTARPGNLMCAVGEPADIVGER